MQRFKKILVYLDIDSGKHEAIPAAAKLAKATGGALKIVDAVKDPPLPHVRRSPPRGRSSVRSPAKS